MKASISPSAQSQAAVEDLVRAVYRLGLVQRQIARHALAELGSQGFLALAIVNRHGPLRIGEVASRLSIDLSVASRQVAALESAGYVRREPDAGDRRAQLVTATEAGARAVGDAHRRMVGEFAVALTGWTHDDVSGLALALDRLREAFAADGNDPEEEVR